MERNIVEFSFLHRDGHNVTVIFKNGFVFFRLVGNQFNVKNFDLHAISYPSDYLLDRINDFAPAHEDLSVLLVERHGDTLVSIFLRAPDEDWDETVELFVTGDTMPGEGASLRLPLTLFKVLLADDEFIEDGEVVPWEPHTVPAIE